MTTVDLPRVEVKLVNMQAGGYRIQTRVIEYAGWMYVAFDYNADLLAEIKAMQDRKWIDKQGSAFDKALCDRYFGHTKIWGFPITSRNLWALAYLRGEKPYAHYQAPLISVSNSDRPLRPHQIEGLAFVLTRRHCFLAYDMGTGKSLISIEAMERSGFSDWWYVAPKSVLRAYEYELKKWKAQIRPRMITYEALVKVVKDWEPGAPCPKGFIVDESARCKTPTAQRSQAVMHVANCIRKEYGYQGIITLLSGAPAPKSPLDWYYQCEIACPGYLRESKLAIFQERLSIVREYESTAGGVYKKPVAWLDDEKKCGICGEYEGHQAHVPGATQGGIYHMYKPSKNELAILHKRMNGLVLVKRKKDVLKDLPEKIYDRIILKPKAATLRAAKMLTQRAGRAAQALILCRELSDGFQYQDTVNPEKPTKPCELCEGRGEIKDYDPESQTGLMVCTRCEGDKEEPNLIRTVEEVDTPKDEALKDLLDEHQDIGRLVVYAGFQASIDRCLRIAQKEGWETIQADGRGWHMSKGLEGDPLEVFQDKQEEFPRVCFIGNAKSVGEGQTLTASPTICFYSNDWDGNARMQAEERLSRIGSRGNRIVDLIHLPVDLLVLENLQKKKTMQAITLGEIAASLDSEINEDLF